MPGSSITRRPARRREPRVSRKDKPGTEPIWQQILNIVGRVPEADLHKLPTDLAEHHDHYLSGQARS